MLLLRYLFCLYLLKLENFKNNIILLFNHFYNLILSFILININVSIYFTNQKLCIYFEKKDIAIVCAFFTFFKSINLINKSNIIISRV